MIICSNRNGLLLRKTVFRLGLQSISTLTHTVTLRDVLTPASFHPSLKHHHWSWRERLLSKHESFHWLFLCCCYLSYRSNSAEEPLSESHSQCDWWEAMGLVWLGPANQLCTVLYLWDIWKFFLWCRSQYRLSRTKLYTGDLISISCLVEFGLYTSFSSAYFLLHIMCWFCFHSFFSFPWWICFWKFNSMISLEYTVWQAGFYSSFAFSLHSLSVIFYSVVDSSLRKILRKETTFLKEMHEVVVLQGGGCSQYCIWKNTQATIFIWIFWSYFKLK